MDILEPRKMKALVMILAGETHAAVARELDIDSKTVRRWIKDPDFAAAFNKEAECINELYRRQNTIMIGRNVEKSMKATELLDRVLNSENVTLAMRMRAAGQLMQNGFRWGTFIEKQKTLEKREAERNVEAAAELKRLKEAGHASPEKRRPGEPVESAKPAEKSANLKPLPDLVEKILEPSAAPVIPALSQNAGKSGQKRTSTSDAERRARLDRMQREAEAAERAQAPAQMPAQPAQSQVA